MACNELGFTERDVRALCDIGASSKAAAGGAGAPKDQTGEKGIGFKSVFAISDKPHIHSGRFSFAFDARDPTGLGYILPHVLTEPYRGLQPQPVPGSGWPTLIWLPLKQELEDSIGGTVRCASRRLLRTAALQLPYFC